MTVRKQMSWAVAALGGVAAASGLLLTDVYPEAAGTEAMLRGYDLLTLVVVVPGLAVALLAQRRGPHVPAELFEVSLLAYLVYTYAYHLLGIGFTDLMLLHAAVLASGLITLVLTLARIDTAAVATAFGPRTRPRLAGGILGVLAVALAAMWVGWSLHNAVTGEIPPGSALVESETIVHLGIVLDLTLLVPLYACAAVLLWRRVAWGLVLGVLAAVAGLLHQVSYLLAMLAQYAADVPGAVAFDPGEPIIIVLYAVAAAALLLGLPDSAPTVAPPASPTQPHNLSRRSHADAR
jgi:hypothetical protein